MEPGRGGGGRLAQGLDTVALGEGSVLYQGGKVPHYRETSSGRNPLQGTLLHQVARAPPPSPTLLLAKACPLGARLAGPPVCALRCPGSWGSATGAGFCLLWRCSWKPQEDLNWGLPSPQF